MQSNTVSLAFPHELPAMVFKMLFSSFEILREFCLTCSLKVSMMESVEFPEELGVVSCRDGLTIGCDVEC